MKNTSILLAIIILLSPIALLAQVAPPATPIDGGLSLLLAAGGAYGIWKAKKTNRNH